MSVAIETDTASGPAARRRPRRGLTGSTLLDHLLLLLLAYVGIVLLLQVLDPFRGSQLAAMAYYLPAVAGLTVLTGVNGQISLGHGALMAVGSYTTAVLLQRQEGLPFLVVLLCALVVAALVGLVVGVAAARLHGPYLAGATLALAVGLPGLAIRYDGLLGGEQGLQVVPPRPPDWFRSVLVNLTGQRPTGLTYLAYLGWALALVVLLLLSNLVTSRYGRQWRAVRDDEVAAELAGIDLGRARVLAFVVSSACAGVGGALLAVVGPAGRPEQLHHRAVAGPAHRGRDRRPGQPVRGGDRQCAAGLRPAVHHRPRHGVRAGRRTGSADRAAGLRGAARAGHAAGPARAGRLAAGAGRPRPAGPVDQSEAGDRSGPLTDVGARRGARHARPVPEPGCGARRNQQ